jgi:hypothetical protein
MSRRIYDYEYLGDPALDGSVRQGRNGDNQLVWERRESGVWTPFQSYGAPYTPTQVYPSYEAKILDVLGPSLVAYWPLTPDRWAEGADGILDVSGNGRHGTNYGATPDAMDGPGSLGRAAWFDGTSSYIDVLTNWGTLGSDRGSILFWAQVASPEVWTAGTARTTFNFQRSGHILMSQTVRSATSTSGYVRTPGSTSNLYIYSYSELECVCYGVCWDESVDTVKYRAGSRSTVTTAHTGISDPPGLWTQAQIGKRGGELWWGTIQHLIFLDHMIGDNEWALISDPYG